MATKQLLIELSLDKAKVLRKFATESNNGSHNYSNSKILKLWANLPTKLIILKDRAWKPIAF